MKRVLFLVVIVFSLVSCQFTETMTLNEDGSGRMSVEMDLSEMMSFGGDMMKDSIPQKIDSIISFKEFLKEKKDSISKLSPSQQQKLKKLENYKVHMMLDSEEGTMILDMFTDFNSIEEANDMMNGFEQSSGMMPNMMNAGGVTKNDESSNDIIGVKYMFKKGVFKRDAYIKDSEAHRIQVDSLKSAEAFMSGTKYKLKYTFPKKIKKASIKDATFSQDGKTIIIEREFLSYFKNPDVLDLEVTLEK